MQQYLKRNFTLMNKINNENKQIFGFHWRKRKSCKQRSLFYREGRAGLLLYTKGGIAAYHDVFDKGTRLPLSSRQT
jgi:hypothetical protein